MLSPSIKRYAAIDIGTVTCRLLIADFDGTHLVELERGYGITDLGEGVDASGYLKPEAMQRVVDQLKRFQGVIERYRTAEHPNITVTALATSASRDAKNSAEFQERLRALGITLTIISGEQEAALSFLGMSYDFPQEKLLLVDVGGGSTELTVGCSGEPPLLSRSFNIGCRRVTERFFTQDPPTLEELREARVWIEESMKPFVYQVQDSDFVPDRIVAVAGTATSVVSIQEKMAIYESARVHRSMVSQETLNDIYENLRCLSLDERRLVVGLDPGRAHVMVAGLLILQVVLGLAKQDSFTVSESDILQGIILSTATK